MSLKAFHILFISAAVLLSFGFGMWCFYNSKTLDGAYKLLGVCSVGLAFGLILYGRWFLRKHKDLGSV